MKHHVHPETFVRTDHMVGGVLDDIAVPIHTHRSDCELTWCTYRDLTDEGKAEVHADTAWAKRHNREREAELYRRSAYSSQSERTSR
jgi:hypothetical protein